MHQNPEHLDHLGPVFFAGDSLAEYSEYESKVIVRKHDRLLHLDAIVKKDFGNGPLRRHAIVTCGFKIRRILYKAPLIHLSPEVTPANFPVAPVSGG